MEERERDRETERQRDRERETERQRERVADDCSKLLTTLLPVQYCAESSA